MTLYMMERYPIDSQRLRNMCDINSIVGNWIAFNNNKLNA